MKIKVLVNGKVREIPLATFNTVHEIKNDGKEAIMIDFLVKAEITLQIVVVITKGEAELLATELKAATKTNVCAMQPSRN